MTLDRRLASCSDLLGDVGAPPISGLSAVDGSAEPVTQAGRCLRLTHEIALSTKHLPSPPTVRISGHQVSLASAVGASHRFTFWLYNEYLKSGIIFSQQIAAAMVSLTPLIVVVTARNVEGEPWAHTSRSEPVGMTLRRLPMHPRRGQT